MKHLRTFCLTALLCFATVAFAQGSATPATRLQRKLQPASCPNDRHSRSIASQPHREGICGSRRGHAGK